MDWVGSLLIGALLGALLTYFTTNYITMLSMDVASLNDHVAQVKLIEKYAVAYWLTDPNVDPIQNHNLETKLLGAISASAYFEKEAKRILCGNYSKYCQLDQELYESATGGNFQSKSKAMDPERVIKTMKVCNELCALLRKSRRSLYWVR